MNFFILDDAMIRLTNAAIQNHYGSQIPLIVDDVIKLNDKEKHPTYNNTFGCC